MKVFSNIAGIVLLATLVAVVILANVLVLAEKQCAQYDTHAVFTIRDGCVYPVYGQIVYSHVQAFTTRQYILGLLKGGQE